MNTKIWVFLMMLVLIFPLAAEEVKNVDLDDLSEHQVKAGIELGTPFTGITAGFPVGDKMEVNALIGSVLNFDSLAIGANLLFRLVNLEVQTEVLPVRAGPVIYSTFGVDGVTFSAGGIARIEYSFDFPLNLYFHTGFIYNIIPDGPEGDPFNFPFALGVRYVF